MDNPLRQQARAAADDLIRKLSGKLEVQALYILSSSARSPRNVTRFSETSDFDLAIVLDIPLDEREWRPTPSDTYTRVADRIPRWIPEFSFYLSVPWGQMEVNVHQVIFQYEADPRTVWSSDKCDAYGNKSEAVFDRDGAFGDLIARKTLDQLTLLEHQAKWLLNRLTWDTREIPIRMGHRVGPATGHFVISAAIEEAVDWLYVSRGRLIPNTKWKLFQLRPLEMITAAQEDLLHQVLQCDPASMDDLKRRCTVLEYFCRSIGVALDEQSITRVRKSYQRSNHQLLGDRAARFVPSPLPRLILHGERGRY